MKGKRWGVYFRKVYEYTSEAEARHNLALAQWDVPAVLVVHDGEGWKEVE